MTAVSRGPQVKGLVSWYSMLNAADWQLRGFKLEPKRSWHMNLTCADTLFDAREEFDRDKDGTIICDDVLLSNQAEEAAAFNEVSSREFSPTEDCGILAKTSSEEDSTSPLAVLASKSRQASKSIFDATIVISNTLIEQRPNRIF